MMKEEIKETIHGIVSQLLTALCENNSDAWFALCDYDINEPNDNELGEFIDFIDKLEEIVREMRVNELKSRGNMAP